MGWGCVNPPCRDQSPSCCLGIPVSYFAVPLPAFTSCRRSAVASTLYGSAAPSQTQVLSTRSPPVGNSKRRSSTLLLRRCNAATRRAAAADAYAMFGEGGSRSGVATTATLGPESVHATLCSAGRTFQWMRSGL